VEHACNNSGWLHELDAELGAERKSSAASTQLSDAPDCMEK
jgi:hypothetical protein